MGVRKETRFVAITALLLMILPCAENIAAMPVPRIAAAMAIFKALPGDLRFGGGGGGRALAPEGLYSLTPAGTSSRNGKVIFLKNIPRPIVKTMPCEPTTMCLALVLKAQLKSFELQRFRGECRRLERRAAQLPSDQPHVGKIKAAKDCDLFPL
jgi:hypothetical protein